MTATHLYYYYRIFNALYDEDRTYSKIHIILVSTHLSLSYMIYLFEHFFLTWNIGTRIDERKRRYEVGLYRCVCVCECERFIKSTTLYNHWSRNATLFLGVDEDSFRCCFQHLYSNIKLTVGLRCVQRYTVHGTVTPQSRMFDLPLFYHKGLLMYASLFLYLSLCVYVNSGKSRGSTFIFAVW